MRFKGQSMFCVENCSVSLAKRECSYYEHALFAGVINSLINLVFTMHSIKDVRLPGSHMRHMIC